MKTKYKISKLINLYKKNIEKKTNLMKVIECMQPAINKYSKKVYGDEYEDVQQELTLALIEAVNKIETYDNEGKVVVFLVNAIKNRFFELCRKSNKLKNEEETEISIIEELCVFNSKSYADIEFMLDVVGSIECCSIVQKRIVYYILCEGSSDIEIAEQLQVSRQYVNKCKKIIFSFLNEK